MYMYVLVHVGGRERARERQKLHHPGQCHLLFKASKLLFFPSIITVLSNLSFPTPTPPPSSWKIWKRKIKRLPPGSDCAQPACLCRQSRRDSAAAARNEPLAAGWDATSGNWITGRKTLAFTDVSPLSFYFFFYFPSSFLLFLSSPPLLFFSLPLPSAPSSPHLGFHPLLSQESSRQ